VLVVLLTVGLALKLTFGLLKWVLLPVAAVVGLVLLVTLGPVLLSVGAVVFVLFCVVVLPLMLLAGLAHLVFAGCHVV